MVISINLSELQEKLKAYLGYYTECFYNGDEEMIVVKVFNVPEKLLDHVENRVFDYEEQYLHDYGCILMAFVNSEDVTKEYYSDVMPKVVAYNAAKEIDNLRAKFLEKHLNDLINEHGNVLDAHICSSINELLSSTTEDYTPENNSITDVKHIKDIECVIESNKEQTLKQETPYEGLSYDDASSTIDDSIAA